tara:strand:+ start:3622 stop:4143 length:522 start_codon:yes stop_codon:yes gene_type:complete
MLYFNKFPTVLYDPHGSGSSKLATNILKRVRVRANMAKEFSLLDPYDVQDGETPEILADRHHGSPYYHWVIMLMNNVKDPEHDWPKSTRQMQLYMQGRYGSQSNQNAVHHYEVGQSSGDTTIMVEVPSTHAGAVAVSNYTYEYNLNEEKRAVDLLRNEYLASFVSEFENEIVN